MQQRGGDADGQQQWYGTGGNAAEGAPGGGGWNDADGGRRGRTGSTGAESSNAASHGGGGKGAGYSTQQGQAASENREPEATAHWHDRRVQTRGSIGEGAVVGVEGVSDWRDSLVWLKGDGFPHPPQHGAIVVVADTLTRAGFANLRALGAALECHLSAFPRIAIVTPEAYSADHFEKVLRWWHVIAAPQLRVLGHPVSALRAMQLQQFRKVLLLDADIVVRRNIDELIIGPAPACVFRGQADSGGALTQADLAENAASQLVGQGLYVMRPGLAQLRYL